MKPYAELPPAGGTYALFFFLPQSQEIAVGKLGCLFFPAGAYVYVGSAQGSGGLRARIKHHLRIADRPRWHIDYFRPHADLIGFWFVVGGEALECAWSQRLGRIDHARVIAPGFGAADCRKGCPAHFWWVGERQDVFGESLVFE